MKIWVAGIPGAWSSQKLASSLQELGANSKVFPLSECSLDLSQGKVLWKGRDLSRLDGVIVKKLGDVIDPRSRHRINLLHQLSHLGVPIFSPPDAIEKANNRYRMTLQLSQAGAPIPKTFVSESVEGVIEKVEQWGQAVLKPVFTSKGRGMLLLERGGVDPTTLRQWRDSWGFPFYLQKYIQSDFDVGIAVLDGETIGSYKRTGGESWQTTTREGGHYETFDPDAEMIQVALNAAGAFDLDYTVVDIVPEGENYLVYEVSAFGGFTGLKKTRDIDAAKLYGSYVVNRIRDSGSASATEKGNLKGQKAQ